MRLQSNDDRPSGAALVAVPGSSVTELHSGVDALYVSGRGVVSPALLLDLAKARADAEEAGEPVAFALADVEMLVKPRGFGSYKYWLAHPHGQLGITDADQLPPLKIQPRTEYLHAVGPRAALSWFHDLAATFTSGLQLSASRVDVYADVQGWELQAEDRLRFVVRGRQRQTFEDSDALTGFVFGRRSTRTVMARLYNKTLDMKNKGTDWWPSVWGPSYNAGEPVLRVEFEFGRQGLKQLGVDAASDALEKAPSLWRYATEQWLSHRTPTADQTRARWRLSPEWQSICGARFSEGAVGLTRIQEGRRKGSLRLMLPGLTGYMNSAGALLEAEDLEETLALLPRHLRDYDLISGTSFEERLRLKRRRAGAA